MENRNKQYTEEKTRHISDADKDKMHFLVLHNDDEHTFEYVIQCLMEICGHDVCQAEQCTWLVHYRGSCDVLRGGYKKLYPYKQALASRDLKVTID